MQDRIYNIRISPEVISHKLFPKTFIGGDYSFPRPKNSCCDDPPPLTGATSGTVYVYSSMTEIVSGDSGNSILNITVPIFLTQNTVDFGYYTAFDGLATQQDTMTNFLFTSSLASPYTYSFYNTSDKEFKRYLKFADYRVDWGDGSPSEVVNSTAPTPYTHTYSSDGVFEISMSGLSPWGVNIVKKKVYTPYTNVAIDNPNGESFFIPAGGNWSATPISYDYIYHYDEYCETENPCCDFISIPFVVTGYTTSSLSQVELYGPTKYRIDQKITGATGGVAVYKGVAANNAFTAYTINDIEYRDYPNGKTIFTVYSSGCTNSLVCSATTKDEALINVISEPEIVSNVFIERGKNTALEQIQRLGEVSTFGDLKNYGYKYFTIKTQ
jgi:hypothetical protein